MRLAEGIFRQVGWGNAREEAELQVDVVRVCVAWLRGSLAREKTAEEGGFFRVVRHCLIVVVRVQSPGSRGGS